MVASHNSRYCIASDFVYINNKRKDNSSQLFNLTLSFKKHKIINYNYVLVNKNVEYHMIYDVLATRISLLPWHLDNKPEKILRILIFKIEFRANKLCHVQRYFLWYV